MAKLYILAMLITMAELEANRRPGSPANRCGHRV